MGIHNRYEILMRNEIEAHKKSKVSGAHATTTSPKPVLYFSIRRSVFGLLGGLLKWISSLFRVSSGLF